MGSNLTRSLSLALLCTLAAGCQASETTKVVIDLSGLRQANGLTQYTDWVMRFYLEPVQGFHLGFDGARDRGNEFFPIDSQSDVFEADLPSGPNRYFVVEAIDQQGIPVYWGDATVDLPPRGFIEVPIVVFQSGVLHGQVHIVGLNQNTAPPRHLTFRATNTPKDARTEFIALLMDDPLNIFTSTTTNTGADTTANGIPDATTPTNYSASFDFAAIVGLYTPADTLKTQDGSQEFVLQAQGASGFGVTQGQSVFVGDLVYVPVDAQTSVCAIELGITPDRDRDGVPCDVDCDDNNRDIFPGNMELCDGIDNDCDPSTADGVDDFSLGMSLGEPCASFQAAPDPTNPTAPPMNDRCTQMGTIQCNPVAKKLECMPPAPTGTPPVDADRDGFSDVCDCDDNASSCTTDCTSDRDGDGTVDCLDRCLDPVTTNFGRSMVDQQIGIGAMPVGMCTTDGMMGSVTPCGTLSAVCTGPDSTADLDTDGIIDDVDPCIDADGDGAGLDGGYAFDTAAAALQTISTVVAAADVIGTISVASSTSYTGQTLFVAWDETNSPTSSSIKGSISTDGGNLWGTPFVVAQGSVSPVSQPSVALITDTLGNTEPIAVWQQHNGADSVIMFGRSGTGTSWTTSPVDSAASASTFQRTPVVVVNAADQSIHVAWEYTRNGDSDIYYSNSTDGINFLTAVRVSDGPNGTQQTEPTMVIHMYEVFIAWTDSRMQMQGITKIRSSSSADLGATWTPSIRVDATPPGWSAKSPSFAHDMMESAQDLFLGYSDLSPTNATNLMPIVDVWVTKSNDQGANWHTVAPLIEGGDQTTPSLAVDTFGVVHMAWQSQQPNGNKDIGAAKLFAHGHMMRTQHPTQVVATSAQSLLPAVVPFENMAGNTGTLVVWVDVDSQGFNQVVSQKTKLGCGMGFDCDDTISMINLNGYEDCFDGIDNDCDGQIDNGPVCSTPPPPVF